MATVDSLARGREAYQRRAWGDAYEDLSAALEPGAEDLDRLGTAAYLTGRVDAAAVAWERAHRAFLELGEVARAARSAFWLGMTLLLRGGHAHGGGWLARAEHLLDDASLECAERGYLLVPAALQALAGGDPTVARAMFDEVARCADRFGDPDLAALARLGAGQTLVRMGATAEGVAFLDEAMVAVTTGEVSPVPAGIIYCAVIIACREIFDLSRAQEWTAALSRWCATQQDLKPYQGQCLVHRSEIMQLRGEWSDAMAEVQQACEHLADPPGDPVMGMALYQQAELLRLWGGFARAEQAYREASTWGHPVHPGLALLRLAEGRPDDAAAAIRRTVDEAQDRVTRSRLLAADVEIMLATGDIDAARAAAGELVEIAAGFDSPYLRAVAAHADGSVLLAAGDVPAAGGVLREAWTLWCELGTPYEAARTRLQLGVVCSRLGDTDTAELEWDGARRVFQELGAAPDLARVDELSQPAAVAGGLTAREVEVLTLVAAGKANRQIAAELVISEHTVRRHLQNVFAKLGVSSRAAATAYAYEHSLV